MLSLRELTRAGAILAERLGGARLARTVQRGRFELVLVLETGGGGEPRRKQALLASCAPRLARLSLLAEAPPAPKALASLPQYLHAHGRGLRLAQLSVAAGDRIARLRFTGPEESLEIVLALMGGRSNLYVLDAEGKLRMALRPVEQTRRDLALGKPWRDPEAAARPEGDDRFEDLADDVFFEALEAEAAQLERSGDTRGSVSTLRRALRRRIQTLERKQALLEQDEAAGERAVELEQMGELLKANLHRVKRRDPELQVAEPGSGKPRTIPLDPALGPGENLEAIFRRYRKELKRAKRAGVEAPEVRGQLTRMRGLADELEGLAEAGAEPAAFEALAAQPELARLLERARPPSRPPGEGARRRPAGVSARLLPKRYRSRTGLEIWVGKSDEGNDHLTTRLARGKDLFFHLDGSPGSHVVLRTEGRADPPSEALLEASELAVHFSKQRGSSRAGVHVSPIKNVRKPSGAKPGLVMVTGGRTLALRHDPARLRRILEARIPEEE
ncbi:MAG: NFACT RNA binding domain-containing protein [Myxococcota bacterium]